MRGRKGAQVVLDTHSHHLHLLHHPFVQTLCGRCDTSVVQGVLGKYGIICIEDLIHEIYTVGPHFKEANNFMHPFQLSCAKGVFSTGCPLNAPSMAPLVLPAHASSHDVVHNCCC
jgi:hypothetical protein